MIDQFLADKSDFKKKAIILAILIVISLLGCIILNSYRLSVTEQKAKAYELSKQQVAWLETFDYETNKNILDSTLKLIPMKDVEAIQLAQVEIFRRHKLNIVSIQNGEVKPKSTKKGKGKEKQLDFAISTATVQGSWDNFTACLNSFEKQNLVVITDCKVTTDKQTGLINAAMRYRIYYE